MQDAQAKLVSDSDKKIQNDTASQLAGNYKRLGDVIASLQHDKNSTFNPLEGVADQKAIDAATTLRNTVGSIITETKGLAQATGLSDAQAQKWLQTQLGLGHVFPSTQAAIEAYTKSINTNSDAVKKDQTAQTTAFLANSKALLDQRTAQFALQDAQRAQHDLSLQEVQDADNLKGAQLNLLDAQKALTAAQQEGAALARGVQGAQLDAESAKLDVLDAQKQLTDDQKKHADAETIERDQIALEQAQLRVGDAADAVTSAQQKQQGQAEDVAKAQIAVRDASNQVASASEQVQQNAENEAKAQLAVDSAAQGVNGADLAVLGTQAALVKATNDLTGAYWIQAAALTQLQNIKDGQTLQHDVQTLGGEGGHAPEPSGPAGSNPVNPPFGHGKALGGPVKAGTAYRVGENEDEYFIPGQDGTINRASETKAPAPSHSWHVTNNIYTADPTVAAVKVTNKLKALQTLTRAK